MGKAPFFVLSAVLLFGMSSALSGCSNFSRSATKRNPAPCPNILVLNEAARIIDFNGKDATLENVAYTGEITDVNLICRYFDDKPISGELDIDFALGRGPAADSGSKEYTYFVAITRKNLEVIAKQEFIVKANFGSNRDVVTLNEKINRFLITRASSKTSGTNFEIIVGFALSREQAIYNRSGKSLKFPNL